MLKSFGNKLLLKVLGATILVFSITIFFISKYSYTSERTNAKKIISLTVGKYGSELESLFTRIVSINESYTDLYQASLNNNTKLDANTIIEKMIATLKKNKNIVGIWLNMKDSSVLFDKNLNGRKDFYNKNGYFYPYITLKDDHANFTLAAPYDESNLWQKGAKSTKKTFFSKPFNYDVNGKKTLICTISTPIYYNGQFFGTIGMNISLGTITTLVNKIKIYDSGYIFVLDQHGIILAHKNKNIIGTNISEVTNNDKEYIKLIKNAKENKEIDFYKNSNLNNEESYFYSKPFKLGNTNGIWSIVANAPKDQYLANANFIRNFALIALIIGLFIITIIIFISVKQLKQNLFMITNGLSSFFKYLNKESNITHSIDITSDDEFGHMAKDINFNINNTKKIIEEENNLINDVKETVNEISQGYLEKRISKESSTNTLNELKNLFNDMLDKLENLVGININNITHTLEEYSSRNFTQTLKGENAGLIGDKLNELNEMITTIFQDNQKDGFILKESSYNLSNNVNTLNNNATDQAASLEETAASIDEITGNIKQTSQKAQEMLDISNETKDSAKSGKILADDTVKAMDEINETVENINESITVIDQIAFQTNILSLNAAVEAATAGEAGKGFAVVAAEVRNLAARSAEAAKEIKDLVENATQKTNNGKIASNKMIEGFGVLENKIETTNNLIDDVSNAAKEQTIGMTQIADAMNQLDKVTQINASVADKTNHIAIETSKIALNVVENVHKNNFIGKKESNDDKESIKTTNKKTISTKSIDKKSSTNKEKNTFISQTDSSQWESF